jgi:hypothetical protein
MLKRVSVWWSRHVLSAKPAVIYTVAVSLCLLLGWLLALLATIVQERTELQWRAESVARQLELQLTQGEMALSRIDGIPAEAGCLAASAGLAAIVQSVPHARHACVNGRMVDVAARIHPVSKQYQPSRFPCSLWLAEAMVWC